MGEVLSWSESSAVVYANSVLGARCNRNSGIIDLMGSVVGYVPHFGLLTDEGRKATWIVKIETTKKPEAQLLGSAIGMKVMAGDRSGGQCPDSQSHNRLVGIEYLADFQSHLCFLERDSSLTPVTMVPIPTFTRV